MKSYFLILLVLIANKASSQIITETLPSTDTCSKYIDISTNKITGFVHVGSIRAIYVGKDIEIWFSKQSSQITCSIYATGHCVESKNKVYFLFDDASKFEVVSSGEANCNDGRTFFMLSKSSKELDLLKTKKLVTIRVMTTDGYKQGDLMLNQQVEVLGTINCLSK